MIPFLIFSMPFIFGMPFIFNNGVRERPWIPRQDITVRYEHPSHHALLQQYPSLYSGYFNRTMLYKAVKLYTLIYLAGLVRKPYVKAYILAKQEAEQQVQEEEVTSLLSKIDIRLADYPQSYFIIISAYYDHESTPSLTQTTRNSWTSSAPCSNSTRSSIRSWR